MQKQDGLATIDTNISITDKEPKSLKDINLPFKKISTLVCKK